MLRSKHVMNILMMKGSWQAVTVVRLYFLKQKEKGDATRPFLMSDYFFSVDLASDNFCFDLSIC